MFNFNSSYQSQHDTTNAPRDFETLQKARRDLIGEIQAVIEYDEHAHSTNNRVAMGIWEGIKNEELAHVGELLALINYLDPTQKQYVEAGIVEFNDLLNH